MNSYDKVFRKNRQWIKEKLAQDPDYFKKLAQKQNPDILFIGCSDSRILLAQIMGLEPGEVFVHRNIANLVSVDDLNAASVIDFAVRQLNVKNIIVCGHYNCGGVGAAMTNKDYGLLNPWLDQIKKVSAMYENELSQYTKHEDRYRRLVELNVKEQCHNIFEMPVFIERRGTDELPSVHGWVYDFDTGEMKDQAFDFDHL